MWGGKRPKQTITKKSETHRLLLITSFIESAVMANGESICLTVTGKPHHQIPWKCTHTAPACPMNSRALLEPSCSPGNALPSQQCGNSLLKQKDIALLGVIKPIKNPPRAYLCLVKSHDWDFVECCEPDTWGGLSSYFLNSSLRDVCVLFMFVPQQSVRWMLWVC